MIVANWNSYSGFKGSISATAAYRNVFIGICSYFTEIPPIWQTHVLLLKRRTDRESRGLRRRAKVAAFWYAHSLDELSFRRFLRNFGDLMYSPSSPQDVCATPGFLPRLRRRSEKRALLLPETTLEKALWYWTLKKHLIKIVPFLNTYVCN